MRAIRFLAVWSGLALSVFMAFSQAGSAPPVLNVDESKLKFLLEPRPLVQLAVSSSSREILDVHVHLEVRDPADKIVGVTDSSQRIAPGGQVFSVPWSKPEPPSRSPSALYWYRLVYRITPQTAGDFAPVEGIVPLGPIMPTLFRMRVFGSRFLGLRFPSGIRVLIDDPKTGKALSGIPVELEMDADQRHISSPSRIAPSRPVRTDSRGFALLYVKPPSGAAENLDVTVKARRGPLEESETIELNFDNAPQLTVTTDKPIYQPGQTLHLRVLAYGPDHHALANAQVSVNVEDHDSNVQFRQELKTSRFGIAQADWEIPSKSAMGPHHVRAVMEAGDGHGEGRGTAQVQISRYDLPEFTVLPATDKAFYLPGEKIGVQVSADYLFGKPVTRGKVRITRDPGWTWDPEKQRWKIGDEELQAGELDASGKFKATTDLSDDFEGLRENDYRRFKDVRLIAYVTDLSTRRTEQRRFTARLSKQTVHIYVLNRPQSDKAPLDLLITTSYPDGTPASLDVDAVAVEQLERRVYATNGSAENATRVRIGSIRTDRNGIGRLRGPSVAEIFHDSGSYWKLELTATGPQDRRGTHTEGFQSYDRPFLKIYPYKRLLREGESIVAEVRSSLSDRVVFVDLFGPDGPLETRRAQLRHGHALVEFPWQSEFHHSLELVAFAMDDDETRVSSAEVLFPGPQDLDLDLHTGKTTYKPGDPVTAQFRVRSPDGRPVESALGIVVFDQAVAERVRSDAGFGRYGFYYGDYYDNGNSIAGVSYHDLLVTAPSGPFPPERELIAQALLSSGDDAYDTGRFDQGLESFSLTPLRAFDRLFNISLRPVESFLADALNHLGECPETRPQLDGLLARGGIRLDTLRDPWGMPYDAAFSVEGTRKTVAITSRGPDKSGGTSDDFKVLERSCRPYFASVGRAIDSASFRYTLRTGEYIRDYTALAKEVNSLGIDLNTLTDPWGHPYRYTFDIERENYTIEVTSAGPDGVYGGHGRALSDDVREWRSIMHYFRRETAAIGNTLRQFVRDTGRFAVDGAELRSVLAGAGIDLGSMRDPWGRPYHFELSQTQRYTNRIYTASVSAYGAQPEQVMKITPVTETTGVVDVYSYGPQNRIQYRFTVAHLEYPLLQQSGKDPEPKPAPYGVVSADGSTGAIFGTIKDQVGAVISGARVHATNVSSEVVFAAVTGGDGQYRLENLPVGKYTVGIDSRGFKSLVVTEVPVNSSAVTTVDAALTVATAVETVEVSAEAPLIETTVSQIAVVKKGPVSVREERPAFTPRVRKYFPETLVWQPELVTDRNGRGELKFQMADNITAWKVSVIGSTEDGKMGFAEKELRTFLPFFADFDPPKVLTEGDHIELPVVLRNYTEKPQGVDVNIETEKWFSLLGPARRHVTVPPGQDANAPFMISADQSVKEGKQRITAANRETGDAIERQVAVHPDGEEVDQTAATVVPGKRGVLELSVPFGSIPGSIEAQLKIYPDLSAHVIDALDGMVVRPAGCGEQITSIAFASVLALKLLKKAGQEDPLQPGNPNAALARRARNYVSSAYSQLQQLETGGGFSYWRDGKPDVALTAYILDFLTQASEFVDVDPEIIDRARKYLVSSQHAEGWWGWKNYDDRYVPDVNITALVANSLAASMGPVVKSKPAKTVQSQNVISAIEKALQFLDSRTEGWSDPYATGQFALAAAELGRPELFDRAWARLSKLAHEEGPGVYWNLEANTSPFYGWGLAGRVETTGVAVRALAVMERNRHDEARAALLNRGLTFLLNCKDRYGAWYSTQASIRVLRAIVESLPSQPAGAGQEETVRILINGQEGPALKLPAPGRLAGPLLADISSGMKPGINRIELVRTRPGPPMQAQAVAGSYIPWSDSRATSGENLKPGESRALRLRVAFDKTEAKPGEPVVCSVQAERIGFAGYGMMLAEIGLPPGADVDRQSLRKALENFDVSEYDVLPDRVIVYLWPRAGGSKFNFTFKPRFAMEAAAAPSVLYDYYNPEARAVVEPARFVVR